MSNKLELETLNTTELSQLTEDDLSKREFFILYKNITNAEKIVKEAKNMLTGRVSELMVNRLTRALENGFTDGNIATRDGKVTFIMGKIEEEEYFDVDMFKFENPDLYSKYLKKRVKETKDSIRITPSKEI